MRAWIYIVLAAFFQMLWGICLKHLDFPQIIKLIKTGQWSNPILIAQAIPLLSYFVLGLFIVIVVSKAYKLLPMSIVYAAWMGLTLLFQVLVDAFYFGDKMNILEYSFIALILIGIVGMKQSGMSQDNPILDNSILIEEILEDEIPESEFEKN